MAPCTNASISKSSGMLSRIRAISERLISRATTTRLTPKSTPSQLRRSCTMPGLKDAARALAPYACIWKARPCRSRWPHPRLHLAAWRRKWQSRHVAVFHKRIRRHKNLHPMLVSEFHGRGDARIIEVRSAAAHAKTLARQIYGVGAEMDGAFQLLHSARRRQQLHRSRHTGAGVFQRSNHGHSISKGRRKTLMQIRACKRHPQTTCKRHPSMKEALRHTVSINSYCCVRAQPFLCFSMPPIPNTSPPFLKGNHAGETLPSNAKSTVSTTSKRLRPHASAL